MANWHYVRADEVWSRDGSMGGTVDAAYEADWLVDGRSGRPARGTGGSVSWPVTNAVGGQDVTFVGIFSHNVTVAVNVTGVSATIPAATLGKDGIPYNNFALIDPAGSSSSTVTFGVSGNPSTVVIGEAVVGNAREFPRPFSPGTTRVFSWDSVKPEGRVSSILPYYDGIRRRVLSTEVIVTAPQLDELRGIIEAERGGSRYSVIIPDPLVMDAWLVTCTSFEFQRHGLYHFSATIQWVEQPSVLW